MEFHQIQYIQSYPGNAMESFYSYIPFSFSPPTQQNQTQTNGRRIEYDGKYDDIINNKIKIVITYISPRIYFIFFRLSFPFSLLVIFLSLFFLEMEV